MNKLNCTYLIKYQLRAVFYVKYHPIRSDWKEPDVAQR